MLLADLHLVFSSLWVRAVHVAVIRAHVPCLYACEVIFEDLLSWRAIDMLETV